MNTAGAEALPSETTKSGVPLKTTPVGVPEPVPPPGGGIMTTSGDGGGKGLPLPSESGDTPALLSEIQKGPVGGNAMPQGLIKLGAMVAATPGNSETRFSCL